MRSIRFWSWILVGVLSAIEAISIASGRASLSMARQIGSDVMIMMQAGLLGILFYHQDKDNEK